MTVDHEIADAWSSLALKPPVREPSLYSNNAAVIKIIRLVAVSLRQLALTVLSEKFMFGSYYNLLKVTIARLSI
jgi:hypothetical protein